MLEEEKVKKLTMIHGEVDSGSYQSQKSLYSGNSSSNVDYLVDRVLATHYRKQKAKDRLPWRKILSAMLALFVVLAAIPYILPPLYGDFSSDIIVSLDPDGVRVNETLFVNMSIPSSYNITSVSVDIAGIDSVSLELVDNSTGLHLWSGFWLVHDVFHGEHVMTISAWDDVNGSYFADTRLTVLPDEEPVSNESLPPDIDDGNVTDNETIPPDVDDTNVTDNESIVSVGLNLSLSSDKFVYNVNESVMLSGVVTFNYSLINTSVELLVISIDFNLSEIVNVSDGRFVYEFVPVVAGDYTVFANLSYSNESVEESLLLFVEGVPVENVTDNVTGVSIVDPKMDEQVYVVPGTSFYVERTINGSRGISAVFAPLFSDGLTIEKFEIIKGGLANGQALEFVRDATPQAFIASKGKSIVERKIDNLCENLPINMESLDRISYTRSLILDDPVTVKVWFKAPAWDDIKSGRLPSSGRISYLTFTGESFDFEGSTWWNANWGYRKLITINSSQVDADLTNFPILVYNSSDSDLAAHAQSNGDDIAFVLYSDNTTKLNHEIENYTASGQIVAWVNVTSISSSSDTKIWMYFNNSGCSSQENVAGTWDSNYTGVWHLAEEQAGTGNADLYQDSTLSNNDGDDNVSATGQDGQINGGQQFDGIDDYVDLDSHIGDYASLSEGSISLWFKYTNTTDIKLLFSASCNTDATSDLDIMYYQPDNELMVGIREDGGSVWIANHPANYSDGSWHHYVLAVDSSGNSHYVNGTMITCSYPYGGSASTQAFFDSVTGLNTLRFGNREDSVGNEYHFDGFIDEVRISNTSRNSSWINTSYNTVNNCSSTFLSFGSEEAFEVNTSVDTINPYEQTTSPLNINATGDSELDNVTLWYRYSSDNSTWWNANWAYRKKLTIDNNQIAADLTNFPVLVNITDSNLSSKAQSDGDDIVFTNATGTKLNHEIELFNDTTGELLAWVNVTSLNGSTDTEIYMYYGNITCSSQQNLTGVWDSNYLGVWHLAEVPSGSNDIQDSTETYNGTSQNMESTDQVSGQINGCLLFDGNGEYVLIPDSSDWTLSSNLDWTLEGWFNFSVLPGSSDWDNMIGTPSDVYCFEFNEDSGDTTLNWWDGTSDHESSGQSNISTNEFHYGVLVLDFGVTSGSRWYLDGSSLGNFTAENRDVNPTGLTISGDVASTYFTGNLDEIRFSNILRSMDWVTTSYNTVNNQSTFLSKSIEETWMQYTGDTNPDEDSPWSWNFDFPNGTGYYEFYSIGKKSGSSDETPPISADAICNKINSKPTHTTPILNSTDGSNSTDENLTCYNQSTSDLDGDPVKNIFNWYKNSLSIMSLNMPFEGGSSSTYTKDYSGQGNDGTVSGATWNKTIGYDGRGTYQFDGIDDYIHGIPNSTINRNKGSIEVWAKPNSFATPQMLIWAGGPTENGYSDSNGQELHLSIQHFNASLGVNGFTFFYGDNEDGIPSLIPGGNHTWLFSGNLTSNIWYHVVVTWDFDNNITKMYVNGTLVDSDDLTSDDLPYNTSAWQDEMHIGRPGLAQRYYNGTLDEVKIYNFSLTPEQVLALSQNKTNIIVSQETSVNDVWQCEITPNDGYQDGITRQSNNLTIIDISVDITPSLWDIGTTTIGNYNYSTLNGYFNLTNNGSTSLNIQIKASNATNTTTGAQWNLTSTPGHNNYSLQYNKSGGGTWTNINLTYDTFVTTLGISSWQIFDLNIFMATTSTKSDPLSVTITFRSVVI